MYEGKAILIKRNKNIHCGVSVHSGIKNKDGSDIKMISICNMTWNLEDKAYEGMSKDITCKRCLKILERADSDGRVKL